MSRMDAYARGIGAAPKAVRPERGRDPRYKSARFTVHLARPRPQAGDAPESDLGTDVAIGQKEGIEER